MAYNMYDEDKINITRRAGLASLTAGDRPAMTAMTAGHDRRGRKYLQSSAVVL